jgi:hypothetical protein
MGLAGPRFSGYTRSMGVFIRAIVTGFGFTLGKVLFEKVSERIGLTAKTETTPDPDVADGDESLDDQQPAHAN